MSSDMQTFRNDLTTAGAILRRASWVNERYTTTSVFCFVRGELRELPPSYVSNAPANGFVAIPVFGLHIPNIQILKRNELVLIDQLPRFLMSKVATTIRRPFVCVTKRVNDLVPFQTTFTELFLLALQPGNVALVSFHPSLAFDSRPVAQYGEGRQAQVNAHYLIGRRQRLGFNNARETGVPIAKTIPANSQRFALPLKWPVKFDLHIANLGKAETTIIQQLKTGLRIGERIISIPAPESRITRLITRLNATKEGAKGQIKTSTRLLQTLRKRIMEKRIFALPSGNHLDGIVSANAFPALLPSLFTSLQRFVVNPSTSIKRLLQGSPLCGSGKKAALERQSHTSILAQLYNYTNCIMCLYPPLERGGFTH